jgi:Gpi18-like mannosyltransferase
VEHPSKRQSFGLKQEWLAACLYFLLLSVIISGIKGFGFDYECFEKWVIYGRANGLRNAYGSGTDYPPLYQYFLWAFGKLAGSAEVVHQRLSLLKIPTLLFDFGSLYVVYNWIEKRYSFLSVLIIALGNIAYSYDTLIWGQIDAIWMGLVFTALFFAWRRLLICSTICIVLACCTKLQSIVFVPLWAVLSLYALASLNPAARWRKAGLSIGAACTLLIALLLPFILGNGGLAAIREIVALAAKRFPTLTLSADNMWPLVIKRAGEIPDDTRVLLGITYKWLGLILFGLASIAAMLPVLKYMLREARIKRFAVPDRELLWLCGAITGLAFFYFNTEMHERYAYPAGIFLIAYSLYTRKWWPLLFYSLALFLNLEVIMRWLDFPNYHTFIFHPRFIAALYFVTLLWLAVLLFKRSRIVNAERASV